MATFKKLKIMLLRLVVGLALTLPILEATAIRRIDEMLPDENEEDENVLINDDGLGGGPEGLVEDLVIGKRPPLSQQLSQQQQQNDNCTNEVLSKLSPLSSSSQPRPLVVTWSTVVNSYSYDPIKNQLSIIADSILSWNFGNKFLVDGINKSACRNVDTVVVEPAGLIWTPRFVFLNNLDANNLLPSDVWEKWSAVVHLDKRLVTWHFASRFTVACSFQPKNSNLIALCPVKIAGVDSIGLLLDSVIASPQQNGNERAFVFKAGEISVLDSSMFANGDQSSNKMARFSVEANAADDVPALVLLARVDLSGYIFGGGPSALLHSFRILRVRILSLQTVDEESSNGFGSTTNLYCLVTFFGSFLVFLLSSVSITFVIISWYEKTVAPSLSVSSSQTTPQQTSPTTQNSAIPEKQQQSMEPPSYSTVTRLGTPASTEQDQPMISCCDDDDKPILLQQQQQQPAESQK